jgi:endo-1,4-beta-xylanase
VTPYQYRKAHIWTDAAIQNINGYDYEYWKNSGNGKMIITSNANNGSFLCEWSNSNNILFRSGKKFIDRDKTHGQLGELSLQFDISYNSGGNAYICVYGWTVDPLVEWYIIEHYTGFESIKGDILAGTIKADGGDYQIYHAEKINKPSILGMNNFKQYWSIRTTGRCSGTVNISEHFHAWENLGLKMGKVAEIALTVESFTSSGNAIVKTNILSINPMTPQYQAMFQYPC